MIVFIDPNDSNQIMALYSHDTDSTVWEERGFERWDISDPFHNAQIMRFGRDARLVFGNGFVVAVTPFLNRIQPPV